jgi:type III pantothenate kinase
MELVIDLGNTLRKIALFDRGTMVHLAVDPAITLGQIMTLFGEYPGITDSIVSSVIHHPPEVLQFLEHHTRFIELNAETPLPIVNGYSDRETLGNDRLAAAVGGAAAFPGEDVLIIGAGTALTVDFVNRRGEYLGGSIAPGMMMRFKALHTFTDKLPLVEYTDTAPLIGKTTRDSILSGVINGMASEIESMTARYREEYPELKVIVSGGDLKYFDKRLKISIFARPNIVLYGLHQILAFNVHPSR